MEHEDVAWNEYFELASERHNKLSCAATGLHVNACYPHLGATPDGQKECVFCGEGVLEVKCPIKHRDKHLHNAVIDSQFCLRKDDDETVHRAAIKSITIRFKSNSPYVRRNIVTLFAGHLMVSI